MKTIKKYILLVSVLFIIGACEKYQLPVITKPTAGASVDFTKTVAVGSSLTAGFMNGALYDAGQNNSFMRIFTNQLKLVGGGDFNQPDINAIVGDYGIANGFPSGAAGRLYLKGVTASPCPTGGPAPTAKIPGNAITAYGGDKTKLNNFSAYKASIQLAQSPALGGPPAANPYYNPWFARFAATPSVNGTTGSTLVGDAAAALTNNGTFFVFWLGIDDVLGFALNGADLADPAAPLTATPTFTAAYNAALNTILTAKPTAKGVLGNIPDVSSLPYFSTVTWNQVVFLSCDPVAVGTVAALNAAYGGFNAALDGLVPGTITQAEANKRKVVFHTGANAVSGANAVVIKDEYLTDIGASLSAISPALASFGQTRQATSADLITLTAGSVLPSGVGVSSPLPDKYVLLAPEVTQIQASIDAFNGVISAAITANVDRLVLFDAKAKLAELVSPGIAINGSALTKSIKPPFGAFSLDGVHPCARGQAYIANKIIEAINAKWTSTIPLCNPNDFASNELPVP